MHQNNPSQLVRRCRAQSSEYRAALKALRVLNLQWLGFKLENNEILETDVASGSISFHPFTLNEKETETRKG